MRAHAMTAWVMTPSVQATPLPSSVTRRYSNKHALTLIAETAARHPGWRFWQTPNTVCPNSI
jgi:hypothetical protein